MIRVSRVTACSAALVCALQSIQLLKTDEVYSLEWTLDMFVMIIWIIIGTVWAIQESE